MSPLLDTGAVKCSTSADGNSVHWWHGDAEIGDPCLCGKQTKQGVTRSGLPSAGERWRYKPNRGSGTFTVIRVVGERVFLRDWKGKDKRISVKTLRGDYELVKP